MQTQGPGQEIQLVPASVDTLGLLWMFAQKWLKTWKLLLPCLPTQGDKMKIVFDEEKLQEKEAIPPWGTG